MRFVFQYPIHSILCVDSSYIIPLYDFIMRIVMDHNERYSTSDSSFSRFRMESFKVVFASNCCSQIYFNNNTRVDKIISEQESVELMHFKMEWLSRLCTINLRIVSLQFRPLRIVQVRNGYRLLDTYLLVEKPMFFSNCVCIRERMSSCDEGFKTASASVQEGLVKSMDITLEITMHLKLDMLHGNLESKRTKSVQKSENHCEITVSLEFDIFVFSRIRFPSFASLFIASRCTSFFTVSATPLVSICILHFDKVAFLHNRMKMMKIILCQLHR